MKNKIAGIILAAGDSTRFGKPKQLLKLNGEYLINRVIRIALNSLLDPIILVLGANYDIVSKVVNPSERLIIVNNNNWKMGQSSSLIEGLNHIKKENSATMYLLGDQPLITSEIINKQIALYENIKSDVIMLQTNDKKTPPIIFSSNCYDQIRSLKGDQGARNIIKNFDVIFLENIDELLIADIDTKDDLILVKMRIANKSK
jgi:molybdenum cofactor cytidylyltransferase